MTRRVFWALCVCALLLPAAAAAQIDVTSAGNKHNLSVTGPGPVKSSTETEICVFCHTPHNANPAVPLWNQTLSTGATYQPYASTTMKATVGLPTGSSKLCLACHDGTVAIGNTINNGRIAMQGVNALGMLTGPSALGTDLRRDHPISFVPVTSGAIVNPPAGSPLNWMPPARCSAAPATIPTGWTSTRRRRNSCDEQLRVGALHRLPHPALLDVGPEHAQHLDQGLHVGAGRAQPGTPPSRPTGARAATNLTPRARPHAG